MPVAGRKPKDPSQRRNRMPATHDWTEVPNVKQPGRGLPELMPNGKDWPLATLRWWDSIATMPHTVLWSDSDWQFAEASAYVAALFHTKGSSMNATELRNREKVMGTTHDFRRDLRIRYVDPTEETETNSEVVNLNDFRSL